MQVEDQSKIITKIIILLMVVNSIHGKKKFIIIKILYRNIFFQAARAKKLKSFIVLMLRKILLFEIVTFCMYPFVAYRAKNSSVVFGHEPFADFTCKTGSTIEFIRIF